MKKISRLALPILLGTAPLFGLQQSQQQTPPPAPSSPQTSAPSSKTAPAQNPSTPAAPAKKPSTADENPFPEDISRKAAQGDDAAPAAGNAPAAPPADTDSSSRTKFQGLRDMTDDVDRISNGAGGYIFNPKLATEDVKVGGFYLVQRDYKGAYDRYKEATLVNPEDADAVFGLAEAARGLNHIDEAAQNYQIYLDAFPDGKKAKEARKALAALAQPPGR